MVHGMLLLQVKKLAQSTSRWDDDKVVDLIPPATRRFLCRKI
jgi:hypothetical protein